MAEAFFNKYASGAVARSAGSNPARSIDPKTVDVMKEKGIDLTDKGTTALRSISPPDFDFVVTMGCGDACPVTPKDKTITWDIENPRGKPLREYRRIRDVIESKVVNLIAEIDGVQNAGEKTKTVRLLKALGDETRIKIVQLLLDGEKCACRLVPAAGKAQPTVSRHLKILEEAGVLESRRVGVNIWYKIKSGEARKILKMLGIGKLQIKEPRHTACL